MMNERIEFGKIYRDVSSIHLSKDGAVEVTLQDGSSLESRLKNTNKAHRRLHLAGTNLVAEAFYGQSSAACSPDTKTDTLPYDWLK